LYVSPLKALGNDIQKNLDGPLAEIVRLGRERGFDLPEIRTAVRTGDTLMPARQAMLRHPPHILVTTPESLYILLTAEKSRAILKTVRTVIVDEIHAVADDKRGAHLSLSLERLDALADGPVTRIGLSATQKPIELVAQFLAGAGRPDPVVVQVTPRRTLDLQIEVPPSELGPVATHELWGEIASRRSSSSIDRRSCSSTRAGCPSGSRISSPRGWARGRLRRTMAASRARRGSTPRLGSRPASFARSSRRRRSSSASTSARSISCAISDRLGPSPPRSNVSAARDTGGAPFRRADSS
jgi:superfamily II DNA or RNA helicase